MGSYFAKSRTEEFSLNSLFYEIFFTLLINIIISYLVLPKLFRYSNIYFNINDFYMVLFFGILFSVVELSIKFLNRLIF
jgi:hypothetical protein